MHNKIGYDDYTEEVNKALEQIVNPFGISNTIGTADVAASVDAHIQYPLQVFKENLRAAVLVAGAMINVSVAHNLMAQRDRFRCIRIGQLQILAPGLQEDEYFFRADAETEAAFEAYLKGKDVFDGLLTASLVQMPILASHRDIQPALPEILRQATAQTWSAVETFISDGVQAAVAAYSEIEQRVFGSDAVRDQLNIGKAKFSDASLRPAIYEMLRFKSVNAMVEACQAILTPPRAIPSEFLENNLKLLQERRHVIAHRASEVDQDYITKSGDTQQTIGLKLMIKPKELTEEMLLALKCGKSFAVQLSREIETIKSARST